MRKTKLSKQKIYNNENKLFLFLFCFFSFTDISLIPSRCMDHCQENGGLKKKIFKKQFFITFLTVFLRDNSNMYPKPARVIDFTIFYVK